MNRLYRDLINQEAGELVENTIGSVENLLSANSRYFDSVTSGSSEATQKKADNNLFKAIGINITTRKIIVGGLLHSILYDESPINKVKAYFINALKGNDTVKRVIARFRDIGGRTGNAGVFEKHFLERLPSPFETFDRSAGQSYSTGLKLSYAIYQGGIIGGTRPFCRERNNKVFSRDEITKFGTSSDGFGGYTNKSQGEFQGKPNLYNPFTDLGGINCRHQLDWISDELAFSVRPELRK